MNRSRSLILLCIITTTPHIARGHGLPIVVNVAAGKLVVSNGEADPLGYAEQVYVDPDPESWFVPITATEQLTEQPGFQIHDLSAGQTVSTEIISRPDLTAEGHPQRWLWHWNLATQQVAEAPDGPTLDITSQRTPFPNSIIGQWSPPSATMVKLADLAAGDIGVHKHLLAYFLDDSPPAPAGVYGIFGRLIAPGFESSDPFLIALNLSVLDGQQYLDGALAINQAAGLAGDFDVDGDVDGRDLLTWQRTLADAGEYPPADGSLNGVVDGDDLEIWRTQFGSSVELPEVHPAVIPAPEPCTIALAILAAATMAVTRSKRRSG